MWEVVWPNGPSVGDGSPNPPPCPPHPPHKSAHRSRTRPPPSCTSPRSRDTAQEGRGEAGWWPHLALAGGVCAARSRQPHTSHFQRPIARALMGNSTKRSSLSASSGSSRSGRGKGARAVWGGMRFKASRRGWRGPAPAPVPAPQSASPAPIRDATRPGRPPRTSARQLLGQRHPVCRALGGNWWCGRGCWRATRACWGPVGERNGQRGEARGAAW